MPRFDALKQRKIFQWALGYLAGSWVLMQLASWLADVYAWPNVLLRMLPIVLVAGLVIVLVIAWFHGERGHQRVTAAEIAIVGAVVVFAGMALGSVARISSDDVDKSAAPVHAAKPAEASVAVLPFLNMSGDKDNEYFSDGITEEILNVLAQVDELRVAARTSSFAFKGKEITAQRIADSLNVAYVLEGSVRKAGNTVRITAQLINAADGYHLWSDEYDRDLKDVFAVQEEIAGKIAEVLKVKMTAAAAPQARGATSNIAAHDLYLLGLHNWNLRTGPSIERALALFTEATVKDPSYAHAYAGLGLAYAIAPFYTHMKPEEAIPKARAAIAKTIELDSTLAEPIAALGDITLHFERDLPKAARYIKRALALNPNLATAHTWYGEVFDALAQWNEELVESKRALELDPLAPRVAANYAGAVARRDPGKSAALFKRVITVSPEFAGAHRGLARAYLDLKEWEPAIGEYRALHPGREGDLFADVVHGIADRARKPAAIAALQQIAKLTGSFPSDVAGLYCRLGERELALRAFETAEATNDPYLVFYRLDPESAILHGDPRFERLFRPVHRF